ncbi:ATP-binding protein [Kineococcus sp. NUM-3379]
MSTAARSAAPQVGAEELRSLFLFAPLPGGQLEHLAAVGRRRTYPAGATVYTEQDEAGVFLVLLSGRIRLLRTVAGQEELVTETDHRGAYAGAVRAFVEEPDQRYLSTLRTVEPSSFFELSAADFAAFMHEHQPMAVHLLDGLFLGVRAQEATVRQREHLARLGTLSAHLAHELNNPAAAAVRATGQLRGRIAELRRNLAGLTARRLAPETLARLVELQERAVAAAATGREPLGPLQVADAEDELADRLDALGVPDAGALAAVFVAAGLDADTLEEGLSALGEPAAVPDAAHWLACTLESEALLDEITDSTGRISALVAAVKQYSYVDTAAVQEVDLHTGLDSTLVMLGHKLRGVRLVREYDRALPRVQAHAAELNQVWTNLIDNAADAMGGEGTLVLRTHRCDPPEGGAVEEWVCVDVGDDGPGIPEAVRARVFEAFFTTKAQGEGSGLGLDNARRIVEQRHGGVLSFETSPAGTTFHTRLPVRPARA